MTLVSQILVNTVEFNQLISSFWLTIMELRRKVNYGYLRRREESEGQETQATIVSLKLRDFPPIIVGSILFSESIFNELSGVHV